MPRCACLLGSHLTRSKTTANGKMAVPLLSNYARSQHACAVTHCLGTEEIVTEMSFTSCQRLSGRPISMSSILFQRVGPRQDNADPRQGSQDHMLSASRRYQSYVRVIHLHQCVCIYFAWACGTSEDMSNAVAGSSASPLHHHTGRSMSQSCEDIEVHI
jgi:hypothetical protein